MLDRITPILKYALLSVDEGDLRDASDSVHVRRIERSGNGTCWTLDFRQVRRIDSSVSNRQLVRLPRPVVDDGEGIATLRC